MIKSTKICLLGLLLALAVPSFAQNPGYIEGMWLPNTVAELKGEEMVEIGLEISPDSIYSEDNPSLKDAVVVLSGGSCTAGAISPNGLLITNHHCAYDEVAAISTPEEDYLTQGFWPENQSDEIPLKGMTAGFLKKIEKVTDQVLENGQEGIQTQIEAIIAENEQGGLFVADVAEMYHGLEYYLYVYEVYTDVRLAGVPPQDIGKFGYDTDNWMWPRHTGDFALLRVYADSSNRPADYSPDNQPYQPVNYFPVSNAGVEKDDFTMIMGYPGTTTRYLTSFAVSHLIENNYPDHITMREITTSAMKEAMAESEGNRLQLSGDYASLMNYYKYFKGASTMLKRNDIVEKRKKEEMAFQAWAEMDPERRKAYGSILEEIEELYALQKDADHLNQYLIYAMANPSSASKALYFTFSSLRRLETMMSRGGEEAQKQEVSRMKEALPQFYEDFLRGMDKKIYTGHLKAMYTDFGEEIRPELFDEIVEGKHSFPMTTETDLSRKEKRKLKKQARKNRKKWDKMSELERFVSWTDTAYERSLGANPAMMEEFLQNPDKEVLGDDPLLLLVTEVLDVYRNKALIVLQTFSTQISGLRRDYIKGMMEMNPDRIFYPDANSTTRFSYGKVLPYSAGDSVTYNWYTSTEGIMAKYDPENPDYQVPEKLRTLINSKDFGDYADEDGYMPVNFLTTNDITGGNSGSPVLNGKGELVGVAFDGNWESMCGDVQVLKEVNRTIVADARYVLFIIDKYGEADRLIREMTIVK